MPHFQLEVNQTALTSAVADTNWALVSYNYLPDNPQPQLDTAENLSP